MHIVLFNVFVLFKNGMNPNLTYLNFLSLMTKGLIHRQETEKHASPSLHSNKKEKAS